MTMQSYPKRLIEVDLPIARISTHARREKSIRHGHISTLHIWWARRPLASCRAVICASLWPDPVDLTEWAKRGEEVPVGETVIRPGRFLETARERMSAWGKDHLGKVSPESYADFVAIQQGSNLLADPEFLRRVLLDFIADFANWDNSTDKEYLATARALTEAAHEALGGEPGSRPLVADPFAGGGAIPLEALRVGADAFASDLNPVAVLLEKVILEYVPKYGDRLADEVRKWGKWIRREAEKELAEFYPKDPDGATPIAYLWARTIRCEGPGCGAEVPLLRSAWIAKKGSRAVALSIKPKDRRHISVTICEEDRLPDDTTGTVKRSSATCPCCGYTTSAENVRAQFKNRRGGANDARMLAVITSAKGRTGRSYRNVTENDLRAVQAAERLAKKWEHDHPDRFPTESLPYLRSIFNIKLLGVDQWRDLFSSRQLLAIAALNSKVAIAHDQIHRLTNAAFADAVSTCLALVVGRQIDKLSSLARWDISRENAQGTFGRQALGIVWDFNEVNPFSGSGGDWDTALDWVTLILEREAKALTHPGHVQLASATAHPLPDDSISAFITDPPYYDAIPYADLSDFFYVWLKRSIKNIHPELFKGVLSPKRLEVVQLAERNKDYAYKTKERFESLMRQAMEEGRRTTMPAGLGVIVFAHKETAAWEVMLQAVIDAGWIVTASWPIDTEMASRMRALNSAVLASSVHLVCRPRENPDGSVRMEETGDWRDVLQELPRRIHEWMPRLAEEGVVGADAIFACLGPALEIFSRYSRVERTSGEVVPLGEYLVHVWAAVSKEALSVIFRDPDTAGLEPDARLTAMWLWTLGAGTASQTGNGGVNAADDADEEEIGAKGAKHTGFILEYDAARKIAQGLGAHLEKASSFVEVKGDTARLLSVTERTRHLFGKDAKDGAELGKRPRKKQPAQTSLFAEMAGIEEDAGNAGVVAIQGVQAGATVLDRVHQGMILFGAGRGEALKRFLVEDGVGNDARLWKLAQALSALYPVGGDEKRWVDGVLARKKGLGF